MPGMSVRSSESSHRLGQPLAKTGNSQLSQPFSYQVDSFAMVLSIIGTMGWIGLNLVCFSEPMFAGLWLYGLSASVAFLIWLIWRIVLFRRKSPSFQLRD
jgi:hypothetical protein